MGVWGGERERRREGRAKRRRGGRRRESVGRVNDYYTACSSYSHSRMDLVPFYARLVATLHPCLDDIAPALVDMLMRDFRFQVRKKDQVHIHSKLKNVRFIGECVCVHVRACMHACVRACVHVCVCVLHVCLCIGFPLLQLNSPNLVCAQSQKL